MTIVCLVLQSKGDTLSVQMPSGMDPTAVAAAVLFYAVRNGSSVDEVLAALRSTEHVNSCEVPEPMVIQ